VRRAVTGKTGNGMKAACTALAVLATAVAAFYFGTGVHAAKARGPVSAERRSAATEHEKLSSKSLSLPMFFEPNQGQTDPQVKFLARGSGYGLFLTGDEAVLELQGAAIPTQTSAAGAQRTPNSVIRMRLEGASPSARVSGAEPLPGRSSYFIGPDPARWRRDIPQFGRVEYTSVYPGINLVYYGNQGQLEYDFRIAPAADPSQIALSFTGASAHIVSGNSEDAGDLILATAGGNVRFHAPRIYQPAAPGSGKASGNGKKTILGGFRQFADNKIGFTIGEYDHNRELVIDPVLSYSTYLGAGVTIGVPQPLVKIAIDPGDNIYVAGSTTSASFPVTNGSTLNSAPNAQNIFISKINPSPLAGDPQLVYSAYLGGSGIDSLAGLAVDTSSNIYVAGTTSSTDFPTSSGALPQPGPITGTHGFVTALNLTSSTQLNDVYDVGYSTYLAGNGADTVTGLAIDQNRNAYVTGTTASSNAAAQLYPFPASPSGYQTVSNSPGKLQFFASKIDTNSSGYVSMLYSTYFGGAYPSPATATGGGIAVDPSGTNVNMYFTGTTNMLFAVGTGVAPFPILDAQQSCLNEASNKSCTQQTATAVTDGFVAKINPNYTGAASLIYSTYIGGSGNDSGVAIAVDSSSNAYVTGATSSNDWVIAGASFQTAYGGLNGASNAYIAKIGSLSGTIYPLSYFTYLGGAGPDVGQAIQVDSVQAVHVVGSTSSPSSDPFPVTPNAPQACLGEPGITNCSGDSNAAMDAFVASISTTAGGTLLNPLGDFSTYLGGSGSDQGTGVAIDIFGATYAAGVTQSSNFPIPASVTPYQGSLIGSQDAFVSKISAVSSLTVTPATTSPSPNPVAAGTQVAFTFDIANAIGTDPASLVVFTALGLPQTGLASLPTAKVTSGSGSCGTAQGSTISCNIPNLAVNATASVEVDVTPAIPVIIPTPLVISGSATANNSNVVAVCNPPQMGANIVDFTMSASTTTPVINAGDTAQIQVVFTPTSKYGYNATITPSQTVTPSIVTAPAPSFSPTSVTLSGSGPGTTTLSIPTVARPISTGSMLRRRPFYAAWLPVAGLSLIGLGLAASSKRRRWVAGAVLGLIAGMILLQPGCGSSSTTTSPSGGTQPQLYTITIAGSAGTSASHNTQVTLQVN